MRGFFCSFILLVAKILHQLLRLVVCPIIYRGLFYILRSECAKRRDAQSVSWDITKNGGGMSLGNVSKRMCVCRDLLNKSVGFLIVEEVF